MSDDSKHKRIRKNFEKRFGNRFSIAYPDKPLSETEQHIRNKKIYKATKEVLTDILGRKPTERELLGFDDLSKHLPKKKK